MTEEILKFLNDKEDLLLLSKSYKKGDIKLNISKISRKLKVDRKTVRRYLNGQIPKKKRNKTKYLDNYIGEIKELLNDPIREFDYIDHLYRYMKREYSITCNRVTFNRYIRNNPELNDSFKANHSDSFTVRFETEPGQQVQFDLKEKVKLVTTKGETIVVYIPTLTFGWSRFNYRKIVLDTKVETLLAYLAEAFEELGGVPKEIVIDNLKSFVEKSRFKDNPAILSAKFDEFCKDYGIVVKPCMPSRPKTKGKTETQNKVVDELKNYSGHYKDIDEIHEKLRVINKEDNEAISQATKLPRIFLFNKEKGELNPLPAKEIRIKYHLKLKEVIVSNESLISYKSNKYSVPKKYIGLKVGLTVEKDDLHIYYNKQIITKHKITNKLLNIKPEHDLVYKSNKTNKNSSNKEDTQIIKELRNINYD